MTCKGCGLPNPDDPRHGTLQGYAYHKCRCIDCKAINAKQAKAYRKENPEYFLAYERNRAKTPKRIKSRRKYSADNSVILSEKARQFRLANLELYRAYESRRRKKQTLPKGDRVISVAYRVAIANDNCYYCNKVHEFMQDDHYFPLAKGGTDHWWNIVRSCRPCNQSKSAKCGTWYKLRRTFEDIAN